MIYNYKCVVSKNGSKMYYKKTNNKWKRISNKLGMKAEKEKRKYYFMCYICGENTENPEGCRECEIKRLKLDIAVSFIMTLTGSGMQIIIDYLNKKENNNVILGEMFNPRTIFNNEENMIDEWVPGSKFNDKKNMIFPMGETPDSVHWLYRDNRNRNNDELETYNDLLLKYIKLPDKYERLKFIELKKLNRAIMKKYVHDPLKYKMMEYGHQFCQSHAIMLAYFHNKSINNSSPLTAYNSLVDFWKNNLKGILNVLKNTTVLRFSIADVLTEQIKSVNPIENVDIYGPIIKDIEKYINDNNMVGLYQYLINILDSDYARENAPYFT